jgi:hypothetical protein
MKKLIFTTEVWEAPANVPGSFVFGNIQDLTVNHKFIHTRLLNFDLKQFNLS